MQEQNIMLPLADRDSYPWLTRIGRWRPLSTSTGYAFGGVGYFLWASGRWGFIEGVRRWCEYEFLPRLRFERTRERFKRWRQRERRQKQTWGSLKTAIDRDGDLYLVECPVCHTQAVSWNREKHEMHCARGDRFKVYTEDGVRPMRDHRKGDIKYFPASAVYDPGAQQWRLGLTKKDHPWWWTRRSVERDLCHGKDAHGHKAYEILPDGPLQSQATGNIQRELPQA